MYRAPCSAFQGVTESSTLWNQVLACSTASHSSCTHDNAVNQTIANHDSGTWKPTAPRRSSTKLRPGLVHGLYGTSTVFFFFFFFFFPFVFCRRLIEALMRAATDDGAQMWKGLGLITDSPSPIVVVLSGSMEPAFQRGDLLFLWNRNLARETEVGEVVVYNVKNKEIPIVHRVVRKFGSG